MANEIVAKQDTAVTQYKGNENIAELFAQEMDGFTPTFERIRIPSGGGLAYEVPTDDPDSPDMIKEFKAVILYQHPLQSYYKDDYTGGNNPPDCGSLDGHIGIESESGEVKNCQNCPLNKFGSGKTGKSKACKQKRRLFVLKEGDDFPYILTIPTGSINNFGAYLFKALRKCGKPYGVVTKFSLRKAQNAGGINYSQVVCTKDRDLTEEELQSIAPFAEQISQLAAKVSMVEDSVIEE
jgi:hypothetical protein